MLGLPYPASLILHSDSLPGRLEHPHQDLHLRLAADEEGRALMQSRRLDVEDAALAVGGHAAGLLAEEGDGVGFVHEPKLALSVLLGRRIEKDAALEEGAVKVGDEGADVARRVSAAG